MKANKVIKIPSQSTTKHVIIPIINNIIKPKSFLGRKYEYIRALFSDSLILFCE